MVFVPWGERPGSLSYAAQRIKRMMTDAPKEEPAARSRPRSDDPNIRLAMAGPRIGSGAQSAPAKRDSGRGAGDAARDPIDQRLDYVGASAATSESVASQLPGRERGPH